MRYLITGGAGFIGSHIVEKLVPVHEVRVMDNLSTGKLSNLHRVSGHFELIQQDIRDFEKCLVAMDGVDYVLHQAALPSVPRSVRDPKETNDVNVTGTLNILRAARYCNVKRVVYASSSSVYGDSPDKKDEMMPTRPLSPYAVSKLAGENYCMAFNKVYGLSTVCLRYFNVFGRRQDANSPYAAVIPRFIRNIQDNQEIVIYGDGTQARDFTYIDNVVKANLLACVETSLSGIYNIACSDAHSINALAEVLGRICKMSPRIVYKDSRPGDIYYSAAKITKAQNELHYFPTVNFELGLKMTCGIDYV